MQTGYQGEACTLQAVASHYMWKGMWSYIEDFCKHCQCCLVNKASRALKEPLDLYTLEEWATTEYRYFLVIVDLFSNYIEPVTKMHSSINGYRRGNPKIAVSDQASNIDGEVFNTLCAELGIEKRKSSPYHPEGDGQAERSVQTVKAILRCIMHEEGKANYTWPSLLQEVAFKANTATNASTKYTPYEVMYGMKAKVPSSICTPVDMEGAGVSVGETVEETKGKSEYIWKSAAQNL